MIDRIRAGISTPPGEDSKAGKLLDSILGEPNHARPLHVEAILLSAIIPWLLFYFISLSISASLSLNLTISFALLWQNVYFPEPFQRHLHRSINMISIWRLAIPLPCSPDYLLGPFLSLF